jgi:hypothetical protein
MDAFQESYRRAAEKAGDGAWNNMTSRQQNELIFREMRGLDAERLAAGTEISEADEKAAS